jgi:hypothetical protein
VIFTPDFAMIFRHFFLVSSSFLVPLFIPIYHSLVWWHNCACSPKSWFLLFEGVFITLRLALGQKCFQFQVLQSSFLNSSPIWNMRLIFEDNSYVFLMGLSERKMYLSLQNLRPSLFFWGSNSSTIVIKKYVFTCIIFQYFQ